MLPIRIEDNKAIIGEQFVLATENDGMVIMDGMDFNGDKKLVNNWKAEKVNRIRFEFKTERKEEIKIRLGRLK